MDKSLEEVANEVVERNHNIYQITQVLAVLATGRKLPDYHMQTYALIQPFVEAGIEVSRIKAVFEATQQAFDERMSTAWKAADTSKMTHKEFFETYGSKAFEEKYKIHPGTIGGQILITGRDPRENR
jgi:hypothetical protein